MHHLSFSTAVALLLLAIAGSGTVGCGSDSTGPTGSSVCTKLALGSDGSVAINAGCTGVSSSISGITYDEFGRVKAYNFSLTCSDGSATYSGRVSGVTYNGIGQAQSASVSINGTTCALTR